MKTAIRIRKNTGEVFVLARGSSGKFEFGDPAKGEKKHHSGENLVTRDTLAEALEAIADGFHPRLKGQDSGQFNMISPKNIKIIEVEQ